MSNRWHGRPTTRAKRSVTPSPSVLMIAAFRPRLGFLLLSSILPCGASEGPATLTTLVSFDGNNGGYPWSSLVVGRDGNFYGTTEEFAAFGGGTVFRLTPSGTLTTLHVFTGGLDGAHPKAGLIQGPDGSFYGTATDGGRADDTPYGGHGV